MKRSIALTGKNLAVIAVVFVVAVLGVAAAISQGIAGTNSNAALESIMKETDHVSAGELARWIADNRQDYQLVDIREPWQYDDYHIPGAINIPFAHFFDSENLKRLDRNKKIVIYGLGAGHAAQTQLVLAQKGYPAYSLNDGIIAWWDEIMTPTSIRSATPSSSGYQQARQLREYFMAGGRAGAATAVPSPPAAEAIPAPVAPEVKPAAAPKREIPKAKKVPAARPAEAPKPATPKDKEKERLKLGTGCS